MNNPWGFHLLLDITEAQREKISDHKYFEQWVKQLVKDIDMVPYGEPQIIHFGHGDPRLSGWTVLQFIETSNIVCHFNDLDCSAFLDVFSCKEFDVGVVLKNVTDWFSPKSISQRFFTRKAQ
jgi:S-adenosylmethionine/arginine decarboxylase-like enzyme